MKNDSLFVIGHKNPDTDSIVSAIALAELKAATGETNVFAARAGDLNPQTEFILNYFKMPSPRYLPDVRPKAREIMSVGIVTVSEHEPFHKVLELMREQEVRFMPVLDGAGRPKGVVTLMEIAKRYLEAEQSIEVTTSLKNIVETLGAKVKNDKLDDKEMTFSVYIGAMSEEAFLYILGGKDPKSCAVIVGDRTDIQKKAIEKGVGLLIVSGGFDVEENVIKAAKEKGVSIIVSPFDSATTSILVRVSTPVSLICDPKVESVSPEELVEDIKFKAASVPGLVVLDNDGVMQGVITKTDFLKTSSTCLVLVDHNELSQAIDGAEKVNIVEVVDHHRIGNFTCQNPIPFICEPVGSTSTLVAELYLRKGVAIKKEIAGILLGGVLSDTVILKSPTTTDRDKDIVKWLEKQSGLDHMKFGAEIFNSAGGIKKRGPEAVVGSDYKVFDAKGKKFGVGQVETIGFEEFFEEKDKLMAELLKAKDKNELKLSALLVTDIALGTSLLLAAGDKDVMFSLNYPKVKDDIFELKNVISRKKQVVPHILSVFNEIF
ncbi:MAG: putative manganese-dependent inorganic diphosphatase [Deltaproteobacteria bacterium]|nr:putative manganese-dependent inorganic diphosphatase [Deltaproteobacteria bacterium]